MDACTYRALNKLARKTGMDCWFTVIINDGKDAVYDAENSETLTLREGLQQFSEGISGDAKFYGLSQEEKSAVVDLFQRNGIQSCI